MLCCSLPAGGAVLAILNLNTLFSSLCHWCNSRNPLLILVHQVFLPLFQTTAYLSPFRKSSLINQRTRDTTPVILCSLNTTNCSHPLVVCMRYKDSFKLCVCLIHVLVFLCLYQCCLRQGSSQFKLFCIICHAPSSVIRWLLIWYI